MKQLIFIVILLVFLCGGCSKEDTLDARLEEIDNLCDINPHLAMLRLDSIDKNTLQEADRHHYDLLSIKSRDKAYVRHTSDSLIIDVIDYYETHQKTGLYPVALYYGGRVYSDLGDRPAAFRYFKKCIFTLDNSNKSFSIRAKANSQAARILLKNQCHDQAIPYIHDAIECGLNAKDSLMVFYDYILLAETYLEKSNAEAAIRFLHSAEPLSKFTGEADKAWLRVEMARALAIKGDIKNALSKIRGNSEKVDSICRNYACAVAANIYSQAGIMDTAYLYASSLAFNTNPKQAKCGLETLLYTDLRFSIPADSLTFYTKLYIDQINRKDGDETLLELRSLDSNYDDTLLHEKRAAVIKKIVNTLICIISLLLTFALIYMYFLHYFKRKEHDRALSAEVKVTALKGKITLSHKAIANLHTSLSITQNELTKLKNQLSNTKADNENLIGENLLLQNNNRSLITKNESLIDENKTLIDENQSLSGELSSIKDDNLYNDYIKEKELSEKRCENRKRLLEEFSKNNLKSSNIQVPSNILSSPTYTAIMEYAQKKECIPSRSIIWQQLQSMFDTEQPHVKEKLIMLTEGRISETDLITAYLIRLGLSPKTIATICSVTKSAITGRRAKLSRLIFENNTSIDLLDSLIWNL